MKNIRDPIHGYIDVSESELTVINSPQFQRLRRIKQLGLSSTVYPGASHTRFEHSLGVMHLAGRVARSLDLPEQEIKANRLAGLVHDTGHLPFSHTLERVFEESKGYGHEQISCQVVDELVDDSSVTFEADATHVKNIITGKNNGVNIIANDIDVDRLDYLYRDSYETGIDHGSVDGDTLIKFSTVIDNKFAFEHKALQAVESLLSSRLHMTRSVYSHDTVNITETMLHRAVEEYLDEKGLSVEDLTSRTDANLRMRLQNTNSSLTTEFISRITERRLYKDALRYAFDTEDKDTVKQIHATLDPPEVHEKAIAHSAGVPEKAVLVDPPRYSPLETFDVPVRLASGEVKTLEEVSSMVEALHDLARRNVELGVYAPPEHKDTVSVVAKNYFRELSEETSRIFEG